MTREELDEMKRKADYLNGLHDALKQLPDGQIEIELDTLEDLIAEAELDYEDAYLDTLPDHIHALQSEWMAKANEASRLYRDHIEAEKQAEMLKAKIDHAIAEHERQG